MELKSVNLLELYKTDLPNPNALNFGGNHISIIRFKDDTKEVEFTGSPLYERLKPLMMTDCLIIYNN